jgi:hypothetical protein
MICIIEILKETEIFQKVLNSNIDPIKMQLYFNKEAYELAGSGKTKIVLTPLSLPVVPCPEEIPPEIGPNAQIT